MSPRPAPAQPKRYDFEYLEREEDNSKKKSLTAQRAARLAEKSKVKAEVRHAALPARPPPLPA